MIEVVIPAFNAGPFLRETLASIAAQSLPPGRVTVVNDRSTDNTADVAHACATEMAARITIDVIDNAGPRGPSAARNTAIRRSVSEWIALCDSDDLMLPRHLETLLRIALVPPGSVLAFGDSEWFTEDATTGERSLIYDSFFKPSGVASAAANEIAPGCYTLGDQTFPAMLKHGLFGTSACLFRRDAAIQAGLFDETMMFCEDTDFFLRLTQHGPFVFTRERIASKRHHDGNLSQEHNRLAFTRGTALSYGKLTQWAERLPMAAEHRRALDAAVSVALDRYLYTASRYGFVAYGAAVRVAWRIGLAAKVTHPRHLARLVVGRMARWTAPHGLIKS